MLLHATDGQTSDSNSSDRSGSLQVLEVYAEIHEDVASYSYTPISRESCTPERHVSRLIASLEDTWDNSKVA